MSWESFHANDQIKDLKRRIRQLQKSGQSTKYLKEELKELERQSKAAQEWRQTFR